MDTVYRTRMTENGRILIPAECRRLLGLRHDEELLIRIDKQGIHLVPLIDQLRAFRSKVKGNQQPGVKLLDTLRDIRSHDDD